MVSYAQNCEDVVLNRAFGGKTSGFYIDVGANDPVQDSVTKHFYDIGWTGINIEPIRALHAELERVRPRDINLCVGVGSEPGELEFSEVDVHHGRSTFNALLGSVNSELGHTATVRKVPIRTLGDICAQYVRGDIDFLKVDVEGFEEQVFRGHDWEGFRPKVVLAEDNFAEGWHDFVISKGYVHTLHDGLNRFYVREDLVADVGARLNRPAVHAVDGYDLWYYVAQLNSVTEQLVAERSARASTPAGSRPVAPGAIGRVLRRIARTRTGSRVRRILGV